MTLPACPLHGPLPGLGTFCWDCQDYVERIGKPVVENSASGRPAAVPPAGELDLFPDERLEKEIQAGIRRVLMQLGFKVRSLSQPRPTMQSEGLGDLYVTGHGLCAWIEVKKPGEGQRPSQVEFMLDVEANGGTYAVLHSETEAIRWATEVIERARR